MLPGYEHRCGCGKDAPVNYRINGGAVGHDDRVQHGLMRLCSMPSLVCIGTVRGVSVPLGHSR